MTYPTQSFEDPQRRAIVPLLVFFAAGFPVVMLATYLSTWGHAEAAESKKRRRGNRFLFELGTMDSNPRRLESQSRALPTELRPPLRPVYRLPTPRQAPINLFATRTPWTNLAPRLGRPNPTNSLEGYCSIH